MGGGGNNLQINKRLRAKIFKSLFPPKPHLEFGARLFFFIVLLFYVKVNN